MTTPPPPPEDGWPEAETVVGGAPPLPPPGPPVPPPADRRIGAGMLLAIGAIALVVIGFLIAWFLTHRHHHNSQATTIVTTQPPTTTAGPANGVVIPDVRKLKVAAAVAALKSIGVKPRVTGGQNGTVMSESPNPGAKVAKGSEVLLVVNSSHSSPATTTAKTTTTSTTTNAQTTTAQQTTTSSAPAQPATATVPDLSGMDEQAAATALGKAGLLASVVFVPAQDELGTVEAQGKASGTTVPYHSHVQVNVAIGPGTKPMETVPNVIGKTLKDALTSINGANLRLIYLKFPVTSQSQAGKVVQQSPLGNGKAPQNAQVIVYLGALRK